MTVRDFINQFLGLPVWEAFLLFWIACFLGNFFYGLGVEFYNLSKKRFKSND